ncbi:Indoleamine 2,3-dioxygenase 1 [Schistosoma japonicum]|nr:Indoleamine 2,3-dioxygenase 1 [Schistosoma japonicum]
MNNLQFYCLSDKTGAISENPLKTLPSKWKAWNDLVDQLPELSRNKTLRKEVDSLPLLDLDGLNSHEELRLAHKILAFLSSVYVWQDGEGGETESIPIQIAKPLLCVSKLLGIQPILTNSDLVLCNCIPSSSTEGENYLSFLQSIHMPTYHPSWKTFITLSGECEVYFAPILQEIMKAIKAQDPLNENIITKCLKNIDEMFVPFRKSLKNFYGQLNSEEFYVDLRPILCGWSHGKLKDKGLIYETSIQQVNNNTEITESSCPFSSKGSTSDSNRRMCIGASAAQSLTIQACDAFFQIKHHPEDEEFFKKMQTYMITEHRQFLEDLAMYSRIRSIAVESKSSELKSNYNRCLQSLWNFRNSHISLVNRFIIEPSKKAEAKIKQLEVTGTSGQCK